MEDIFYTKVINGTDYEGLQYTALVVAPKTEFDAGGGTLHNTSEEAFQQICDIFEENKLFNELTHYIAFVYPDAQDVQRLVDKTVVSGASPML